MKIRQIKSDEWKKLIGLNIRAFVDNPKYDEDFVVGFESSAKGEKYFKEIVNSKQGVCFVAELNGELIGYVSGEPKEISYRKSRYFEIENLGVDPKFRNRGIGRQLMDAVTKWAKKKDYEKVFLVS